VQVRQNPRAKAQQRVDDSVLRQPTSGTTPAIYEVLRLLRGQPGQAAKLRHLVKYLVEERGERPNVFLYEALLVANWDTTSGSAAELREILLEMSEAGIEPSPGFYHSALQVCLRSRRRWARPFDVHLPTLVHLMKGACIVLLT
jgi:hypothetical protein